MADLAYISEQDFQGTVLQSGQPVLVDFTAAWCGPCKMLEPILKQLADEWKDQVKILKLDVDQNPDLAMQYQVMGVPTLIMFSKGKAVERVTGYQPKDRLIQVFGAHF